MAGRVPPPCCFNCTTGVAEHQGTDEAAAAASSCGCSYCCTYSCCIAAAPAAVSKAAPPAVAPAAVATAPAAPAAIGSIEGPSEEPAPAVANDEDENALLCAICQDMIREGERVRKLRCPHSFHDECMEGWFRVTRDYTLRCPMRCVQLGFNLKIKALMAFIFSSFRNMAANLVLTFSLCVEIILLF